MKITASSRRQSTRKPAPRVTRCHFQFILEREEGLRASDFKKLTKLFDFLAHSMRAIGDLPGTAIAFPGRPGRPALEHPALSMLGDYIDEGRHFCAQRSTPKQLTLALEKEGF